MANFETNMSSEQMHRRQRRKDLLKRTPAYKPFPLLNMLPVLLLLFLMFSQVQSMPLPTNYASGTQQSLSQPHYNENIQPDPGVGFLKPMVRSFLSTVQPNPFPQDLILRFIQQYNQLGSNQEIVKEVLVYEVGFLVCVAIGVLYIVLMPVVGLCLACCRCFGKCGGKTYQEQTSSTNRQRRVYFWSMLITTIVILVGNICMFQSNQNLRRSVDRSPAEFQKISDNLNSFLITVPQQIDTVVTESYNTVDEVTGNFNDIGQQLGTEIQQQFSSSLDPVRNSLKLFHRETMFLSETLRELMSKMKDMHSSMDDIQTEVLEMTDLISATLTNPNCSGCDHLIPELEKLKVDTSIRISGFDDLQSAVEEVIRMKLNSRVSEVEELFKSIPQTVTDDTEDVVQSSIQMLGDIKAQMSRVPSDLPFSTVTKNASQYVETAHGKVNDVLPHIQRAEQIRWAVCVALCSMVLLVVACYIVGLVLGSPALSPNADPTERSSTSNCGGTFLIMGAGFSFIFASLLMIAVLSLFVLGGNIHTLLCRPWSNGQLLELIDTPGLFPELDLGPNLGLKTNLSLSGIYRDCEKNNSLWTTLHLSEVTDVEELLDVSKYTDEIKKDFEKTVISLSSVVLFNAEVKTQLRSISSKIENFDATPVTGVTIICNGTECSSFNHFLRSENPSVSGDGLTTIANKLDELSYAQSNREILGALRLQARVLRRIEVDVDFSFTSQHDTLKGFVSDFRSSQESIVGTVAEVLSSMDTAQDFLDTKTAEIVKTESKKFLDRQVDKFIAYVDWAKKTITQEVGRCGPVAEAVDSVEIVLCEYIVESLNAFWFSLGWCIIFFIPGIIFSVKLSKFYRRMKDLDVDMEDGSLETSIGELPLHRMETPLPPAQLEIIMEEGTQEPRNGEKKKRRKKWHGMREKRLVNSDARFIDWFTKKDQSGLPEVSC